MQRAQTYSLIAAVLLSALPARADEPAAAMASALFEQGRAALKRGDFETACARFRASDGLDPAVGTKLNLADCEEKRGKLATSWELFRTAREKLPPKDERVALVAARIADLDWRVPKLVVTLGPKAPRDTVAREGAVTFGAALFGVPLPMDPGLHELTVTAPGREPSVYEVTLTEGETATSASNPVPSSAPVRWRTIAPPRRPPRRRTRPAHGLSAGSGSQRSSPAR